LLGHRQTFRHTSGEEFEKRMQNRDPVIARTAVIGTGIFPVLKKALNAVERQRIEGNLTKTTRHVGDDEDEKEPQSIAMCLDRGRSQTFTERQFVGEERVKKGAQRRRCHDSTSWNSEAAHRSNR
jgi:hypothetical protein